MNSGKTVFPQVIDFIPPYEFCQCVDTTATTMADRNVLQVDQTAPENQGLLWHLGECREDTKYRVCASSHSQKRTATGPESLHNFTDFKCNHF